MKVLSLVLSVFLYSWAFAQESTSEMSATEMPAAQIADITSSMESPLKISPWKFTLGSENYSYEIAQEKFGSKAPIISYNFVGVRYAPTPKWELEMRQQFQYATGRENLAGRDAKLHQDSSLEMAELVLRAAIKPKDILRATGTIFEIRYYAPTDHVAQENKELGRLRADAWLEWAINPRITLAAWASPRVQFNSVDNPNTAVGADAEYYQVKAAPYIIYNINDHIAPYYAYNLVEKYSQAQRGDWRPDMANVGAHEIGLNLNYGAFFINPSLISETNLNNGEGSVLTKDSRAYSYENLSYNLNVYAVF